MRNNSLSRITPLRWQSWLYTQQTRSHATQEVPDSQRTLSEPQLQEENRSFIQPIEAIARPLEIAERPLMVSDVDSPSPPIKKFSSTSIRRHTSTFITEQPSTLITKHNLSPVRKVSYQQRDQPRLEESPKLVQWRVPEVQKPAVQGQYSTSENRLFTETRRRRIDSNTGPFAYAINSPSRVGTRASNSSKTRKRKTNRDMWPFAYTDKSPSRVSTRASSSSTRTPTPLTLDIYHALADRYLHALIRRIETLQEDREDIDSDYSAGVLTITYPPFGTYVLNKQPPNKQIWLSSPVSGPKRYDYISSEPQISVSSQLTSASEAEWIYMRDGSSLTDLIKEELGVDMQGWEADGDEEE
ncbi:MAG: hypothetical protein Q9190_003112 [Brigantiaea leucoxantha]